MVSLTHTRGLLGAAVTGSGTLMTSSTSECLPQGIGKARLMSPSFFWTRLLDATQGGKVGS